MEQGMGYVSGRDARKHHQPYAVPGYLEARPWMGTDAPPKYRSSPKAFSQPEESPGPPALVPHPQPHGGPGMQPSVFGKVFGPAPTAMARRNERERKRVRLVNNGFNTLRQVLPQNKNTKKKLSKMETLRSAIEYINELQRILHIPQLGYGNSDDGQWPQGWEEAMGWSTRTSPGSTGSSPQTCLSPDNITLDFSSYP